MKAPKMEGNKSQKALQPEPDRGSLAEQAGGEAATAGGGTMSGDTQLFSQFQDNADFRRWLSDCVFSARYQNNTR